MRKSEPLLIRYLQVMVIPTSEIYLNFQLKVTNFTF
jgi:hypothetical protein